MENGSEAETIDEVIEALGEIISNSKNQNSTSGYFAALYRKVTIRVKEGISNNEFENGPRMEKLDVIFANRYLNAYSAFRLEEKVTLSWRRAFLLDLKYWPIVLQHLLIGMNAHINLDLGIAASQVMEGQPIEGLKSDFDKINEILSSLVHEVEKDLSEIWPTLKWLLKWSRKIDNFLIDFAMKIARDGAWKFAKKIHQIPAAELPLAIQERDQKVQKIGDLVISPGFIVSFIFGIIRLGEKGSVRQKIEDLAE